MSKFSKSALVAGLASVAVLGLVGCSAAGSSTDEASSNSASGSQLVVYTNSGSDGRDAWWTAKAKEAGFDIQLVAAGGGDTVNRLIAEKNGPVADVVFGLNNMYFSQLDTAGLIEPYTPSWAGEVDKTLGDTDGDPAFWPLVEQGTVLVYNKASYSAAQAPKDWVDLATNPSFAGSYEVANQAGLGSATTQLILAGIFNEYRDEDGDLGVSDEGWNVIKELFANGVPAETDVPLFQKIADGTVNAGQIWTSGILAFEKQYGVEAGIVQPKSGVPFAIEQVAVVAGGSHTDEAQQFVDWMGSGAVQGEFAAEFDSAPVNTVALKQAKPEALALVEGLKHQDINYAWASENMGDWVEKITLEYLQ